MLTHQETSDLQRFVDAVKRSLPGYRESEQQRQMIAAVADTFDRCLHVRATAETDGCNVLVCESGTGTGKTFAYAIPGLVLARSVGKKLVISSSTVALQEQLAAKDLPFLQSCSPWPFSFALAKGRGRYVCKVRLALASQAATQVRLSGRPDMNAVCAAAADAAGAVVRVRWQIAEEERASVDRDEIERLLDGAAELRLEGRVVPLLRARSAGISAVPTLADKLRRWAELAGVDGEPLAERLSWLQATPADEIVRGILEDAAALGGRAADTQPCSTPLERVQLMADSQAHVHQDEARGAAPGQLRAGDLRFPDAGTVGLGRLLDRRRAAERISMPDLRKRQPLCALSYHQPISQINSLLSD